MNRPDVRPTPGRSACIAITALLTLAATSFAGDAEPPFQVTRRAPAEPIRAAIDADRLARLKSARSLTMHAFPLTDTAQVDLQLKRIGIFTPNPRIIAVGPAGERLPPKPDVVMFSGTIAGQTDSSVFLSFSPRAANGWVRIADTTYVMSSGRAGGQSVTIFNPAIAPEGSVEISPFLCEADKLPAPQPPLVATPDRPAPRGLPACSRAIVAVETDYEYTQLFGGDATLAAEYVATLFGAMNSIYQRDVAVTLQIDYLRLWETPDDPWDQVSSEPQLYQFQNYWNANMTHIERHVTHMLSGRSLGGGIAFRPGLCQWTYNYSLASHLNGFFPLPLQNNRFQNWDPMVVAHELGHNFGAPHTHCMVPPIDTCAGMNYDCPNPRVCTNAGTLMSYCHLCLNNTANIRMEFHTRTISEAIMPYLTFSVPCDLAVPCNYPGDCNADDVVDANDIPCLINVMLAGDATQLQLDRCDLNDDGLQNGDDIQTFVETLLAGS